MKILFAINNDSVSDMIVKKYQKEYKEILTYKSVYYFNAILRELQKDKSYSRIVISEDLEPFANNNYSAIDKFLFDKYSLISEEAKGINNEKIDIILICADRRKKTDSMLAKIYKKNIYNALIGQDRSIDEVCRLINSPRDKEEAKRYYNIQESELGDTESEDSVSEAEVENIRAHYARLGRNEDKYVESFNNIVSQYSDTQLKIIIKYLPIHVKAVLEENSPKYQQLVTTSAIDGIDAKLKTSRYKDQLKNKPEDDVVEQLIKRKSIKSVVIPTNLKTDNVQKVVIPKIEKPEINIADIKINRNVDKQKQEDTIQQTRSSDQITEELLGNTEKEEDNNDVEIIEEQPKRGRGRPRKYPPKDENQENKPKRGRGRPRKQSIVEEKNEELDLFDIDEQENEEEQEEVDLFDIDEQENEEKQEELNLFDVDDEEPETTEEENDLFDLAEEVEEDEEEAEEENEEDEEIEEYEEDNVDLFDLEEDEEESQQQEEINNKAEETTKSNEPNQDTTSYNNNMNFENEQQLTRTSNTNSKFSTILTADKKIVAFVGTTKNGTSFVVNNTAEMLSSMGIETAVLDMTKSKNSYYIYTNNEEELRTVAKNCMENLESGRAEGIKPHKNLSIYTEMPGEERDYNIDRILTTLVDNHSAILIDTDFNTLPEIFEKVQEIYLVQSMDVLTIQPLTAFLRNLKSKGILIPEKLKIVINKSERVRSLNIKTLIGGMANYNAPSMTYMTELFNKDNIKYCEIPFEVQNYVNYLESLVVCSLSLKGYTKTFMYALRELANMVYPLINKREFKNTTEDNTVFSNQVNETLNKMKSQY